MRKVNLTIGLIFAFAFSICIFGCSYENNKNNSSNNQDETKLISTIPEQFMCFGSLYNQTNQLIDSTSFDLMIGYLINKSDIDMWKFKDNDESLVYAYDEDNGVYRFDLNNDLSNRFELFSNGKGNDFLAIKDVTNEYIIYKKMGGVN